MPRITLTSVGTDKELVVGFTIEGKDEQKLTIPAENAGSQDRVREYIRTYVDKYIEGKADEEAAKPDSSVANELTALIGQDI
jgi:hypothetical protein